MKEKGERAEELESRLQKLERENESLQKKVATLGITCEKVCSPIHLNFYFYLYGICLNFRSKNQFELIYRI